MSTVARAAAGPLLGWPEPVELASAPNPVDLVAAARDAGHPVALAGRPRDGVLVAGVGTCFQLVSTPDGAGLEDAGGRLVAAEPGRDRLAAAGRLWRRLTGHGRGRARSGAGPAGPIAIGGFAFDVASDPGGPWAGFPALLFRVPALTVVRDGDRTFAAGDLSLLEQPRAWRGPRMERVEVAPSRAEADWLAAVAGAIERLRSGGVAKVVLARELVACADGPINAGAVTSALCAAFPGCYAYLVSSGDGSAFAGASPELLVRRTGTLLESQPMAGSIGRGAGPADDRAMAGRLRASAKDGEEHRLTARHVAGALAGAGATVSMGPPEVVSLANIHHLATTVRARLAATGPELLELAALLHPTPAVNGWPGEAARWTIRELEGLERGWYAGGAGWLDGRGDGELAVAIRCGLLRGSEASLYAGSGVMPGSEPLRELEETRLKMGAVLDALRGLTTAR